MMDEDEIATEDQLTHEFWKFAERMLPVYKSEAWDGWKPKNAGEIVARLQSLLQNLKKDSEAESYSTGGLKVWREYEDGLLTNTYCFGMEITGTFFSYPFKKDESN